MGQSMNGWIKIHRKIWDNPIVTKDSDHFTLWIYLLTHATHQDMDTFFCGKRITLHPGQLITGRKKIALETGIEEHKVDRILKLFKSDQQIERQSHNQGSLITILQWDKYQISEQQNEQQVSNERATDEQRVSTIQEYKEYKKQKNKEKDVSPLVGQYIEYRERKKKS